MSKNFNVKLVSTTKTEDDFIESIKETVKEQGGNVEEINRLMSKEEGLMTYCARVSSPKQTNHKYAGLLRYCMKNGHWSVFEMCDATFEIVTSRAISAQILRHRSFCFQEFSQRYARVDDTGIQIYEARRQDQKNRQNSIDDLSEEDKHWFEMSQQRVWDLTSGLYYEALERGIAKECARFLLPLNTRTRLYMKGSIRSWVHYIELRSGNGTQQEHMDIANSIKSIFCKKFPVIAEAKGWTNDQEVDKENDNS